MLIPRKDVMIDLQKVSIKKILHRPQLETCETTNLQQILQSPSIVDLIRIQLKQLFGSAPHLNLAKLDRQGFPY